MNSSNKFTLSYLSNISDVNIHIKTDEVVQSSQFTDYLCNTSLKVPHV